MKASGLKVSVSLTRVGCVQTVRTPRTATNSVEAAGKPLLRMLRALKYLNQVAEHASRATTQRIAEGVLQDSFLATTHSSEIIAEN